MVQQARAKAEREKAETDALVVSLTKQRDENERTLKEQARELKLLNTQSAQDVQLLSRLRWVCGEGMIIKVKAQGKTGIPDVMIQITNLEIYFPAWIQIRLAGFGTGLGADSFELGATELPDIRKQASTRTAASETLRRRGPNSQQAAIFERQRMKNLP